MPSGAATNSATPATISAAARMNTGYLRSLSSFSSLLLSSGSNDDGSAAGSEPGGAGGGLERHRPTASTIKPPPTASAIKGIVQASRLKPSVVGAERTFSP